MKSCKLVRRKLLLKRELIHSKCFEHQAPFSFKQSMVLFTMTESEVTTQLPGYRHVVYEQPGIELRTGEFIIPNEPLLHLTFPYLERHAKPGVLVSVGFGRAFDLLCNVEQLSHLVVVDYDRTTLLANIAVLEIARHHIETVGEFEDSTELIEYFKPERWDETERILLTVFTPDDVALLRKYMLERRFNPVLAPHSFTGEIPLMTLDYFDQLSGADYATWIVPENLNELVRRYNAGDIVFALVDVTDEDALCNLGVHIAEQGIESIVSVFDASNVIEQLEIRQYARLYRSLGVGAKGTKVDPLLPIHDKTIMLRASTTVNAISEYDYFSDRPVFRNRWQNYGWGYTMQTVQDLRSEVAWRGYGKTGQYSMQRRIAQYEKGLDMCIRITSEGIVLAGFRTRIAYGVLGILWRKVRGRIPYPKDM